MPAMLRPRSLAAIFGGYFVVVFLAAFFFARDLTSPWYDADLSFKVYAVFLVTAAVILVGLAAIAVNRSQFLDRRIVELHERLGAAEPPGASLAAMAGELPPPLPETKDQADKDIDDLLMSLSEIEATSAQEAERLEGAPSSESAEPEAAAARPAESDLSKRLERVRRMRRAVPRYVLGPAAVSIVVLGVCGIMLPGSSGFLQTYANLNTTLVLTFAYWWPALGAYVVAAIYGLLKQR